MKRINQYEPVYGQEEKRAMAEYLDSGAWLTEFKKTHELEQMLCNFTGAKYAVVVNNGTITLFLALKALGIGTGDEVIVPDFTMAATANAVVMAGAKAVFVDIEKETLCIDVKEAEKAITSKTKAIIHVSLNGKAGQIEKLKALCQKRKIFLIEDSAQSLGSFHNGKHLGRFGIMGSFSFSIAKIVTTGQGGALITDNLKLYKKIKKLKDFGRIRGGIDFYDTMGWNFKFTDIQALIGVEQMKKLKSNIEKKKAMFRLYQKYLANIKEIAFIPINLKETTPWFVDIFVENRDKLMKFLLEKKEIDTRPVYPALHTQKGYKGRKDIKMMKKYPVAGPITKRGLWLPSSLNLKDEEIKYICDSIREFYEK